MLGEQRNPCRPWVGQVSGSGFRGHTPPSSGVAESQGEFTPALYNSELRGAPGLILLSYWSSVFTSVSYQNWAPASNSCKGGVRSRTVCFPGAEESAPDPVGVSLVGKFRS